MKKRIASFVSKYVLLLEILQKVESVFGVSSMSIRKSSTTFGGIQHSIKKDLPFIRSAQLFTIYSLKALYKGDYKHS
jgi:hypothetical protein